MLFLWAVLGILLFTGDVWGQRKEARACYVPALCNFLNLTCDSRFIVIFKLLYVSKASNDRCQHIVDCASTCCQPEATDCSMNYTDSQFGLAYHGFRCWMSQQCSVQVLREKTSCARNNDFSSYAVVDYSCMGSNEITPFHRNTTITAPAITIQYNSTDNSYPAGMQNTETWHCQVDTADCVQRQADVILVKEDYNAGSATRCSSVGWSGGPSLPCGPDFRYLSFNTSNPFHVSVKMYNSSRQPNGWAVVRAQDGSDLSVTCGYTNSTAIPECTATTNSQPPSSQPPSSTQTDSDNTGNSTSSTIPTDLSVLRPSSTVSDTGTTANIISASFSSQAVNASTDGTTKHPTTVDQTTYNTGSSPDRSKAPATHDIASPDTGAVVGGVVAAVMVLVAAVLAVFCFLKRRRQKLGTGRRPSNIQKSSQRMRLTSVNSGSPSSSRPSESGISNILDDIDGDYDKIGRGRRPQNGHAPAPGIVGNPRSPVDDPDYDRLGGKKPQSSSSNTAATYGRLGEVGEDTDYSYDHLARGRQAAPHVIDSDYDTSALHVTSEGDYNVAGIPKKQHVITGSDYDTAEIVTSEGDYNRVDFQGRKQHVITGSDYDTAEIVTSDNTDSDGVTPGASTRIQVGGANYEVAKPIVM